MIPHDLPCRTISLPETDNHSIVVISGNALRHERFALRIQQEFGARVVAWLKCTGSAATPATSQPRVGIVERLTRKLGRASRFDVRRAYQRWRRRGAGRAQRQRQQAAEEILFGDEVRSLQKSAVVSPRLIADPNAPDVVEYVRSLSPYFIATLGGDIFRKPLLDQARGVALNQHDGWCPEYKGSATVNWALYNRDLPRLGNTVHILTSGMDAGPILRRSTACIIPGDSPESCFARSVALGTELMCEVMTDIARCKQVPVFEQRPESGFTYLLRHLTPGVMDAIHRDFQAGWLATELDRLRQF
jgi:Formyl transferase